MWRVSSVSIFTWCLFLLPLVSVAVAAAATRQYRWRYALGFTWASMATAFGESFYRIYIAQQLDQKFQHSPSAQFEIDLAVEAVVGTLGLMAVSGALALFGRKRRRRGSRALIMSAMLGAAYDLVPATADWFGRPMPVALFWAWALTFPMIAARMAFARRPGPTTGAPVMDGR
jgi:hypothetical protein